MFEAEITAATRKATDLANQMQGKYQAAGAMAAGADRDAAYVTGKELAVKLSEARAQITALTEDKRIYDEAQANASHFLDVDPATRATQRPEGPAAGVSAQARAKAAHNKSVDGFIRNGHTGYRESYTANGGPPEVYNSLVSGDPTKGGILLPDTWLPYREPGVAGTVMYDLVTVEKTDGTLILPTGDELDPDDDNDWKARSHTQGGGSNERTGPATSGVKIELNPWNPKPLSVDQQLLANKQADAEGIVGRRLMRLKLKSLEKAITKGNGAGKPQGFMWSVGTTGFMQSVVSQHATLPTWEGMLNLLYTIPEQWASNLTGVCRRLFYASLMAIQDPAGQYVFALSAQAAPNTVLGIPTRFNQYMDAGGVNLNYPYAIANFKELYTLAESPNAERLARFDDSNYYPGAGFAINGLIGGKPVYPDAGRALKLSV